MGILADIARYHLLVAVQRWAGPMLAILCAHEGLRAGAQALPQPQFRASWAPPLTEERDATLRIRLAAMKVIAQAVKPELIELVRKVEEHRITVPAAERRLLAMLPPAEELAQDVLARLVEKVEASRRWRKKKKKRKRCNQYKHADDCSKGLGDGSAIEPQDDGSSPPTPTQTQNTDPPKQWKVMGLESAAKFPAEKCTMLTQRGIKKMQRKINRGFTIRSALGEDIRITKSIISHWKNEHKSPAEIRRRMQVFMEVLRSFKHPQEVWLQKNSNKAYFRAVRIGNKKEFVLGIVVNENNYAVTFFRSRKASYANNKRDGQLLYKA